MAQYTYHYTPAGGTPNPWIVPFGAYDISIACWGAGGCGSGVAPGYIGIHAGGGGGGCAVNTYTTLSIGTSIDISVGSGGQSTGPVNGGDSYISINEAAPECTGDGGDGLGAGNNTGGSGGSGTGDSVYDGGDGGDSGINSGGGGGGAGTANSGGTASGPTAGTGGSLGGGDGGAGLNKNSAANPGNEYGGGGGGAYLDAANGGSAGGDGADGHVTIQFDLYENVVLNNISLF